MLGNAVVDLGGVGWRVGLVPADLFAHKPQSTDRKLWQTYADVWAQFL